MFSFQHSCQKKKIISIAMDGRRAVALFSFEFKAFSALSWENPIVAIVFTNQIVFMAFASSFEFDTACSEGRQAHDICHIHLYSNLYLLIASLFVSFCLCL